MKIIFFYIISGGGGGHTLQKSKSGKELGLIEVNAPIYPVDTKHTFPPGRSFFDCRPWSNGFLKFKFSEKAT